MALPRLLVVNPNTNAGMTAAIERAAREAAGGAAQVEVIRAANGPESIEGQFDGVVSAYWALEAVLGHPGPVDGCLVACYSHHPVTGALREALAAPVVGIMEASILTALPLGHRFAIVTTSARWRPLLEEGVRTLGFADRCAGVRSTGLAVLDLERLPAAEVIARICQEARKAVEVDGADVVCLGCAGMAGLKEAVSEVTSVPVIDGVRAGIALLTGLALSGMRTSPRRLYAEVHRRKPAGGLPPAITAHYTAPGKSTAETPQEVFDEHR